MGDAAKRDVRWHMRRGFIALLGLIIGLLACGGTPSSASSTPSGGSSPTTTSHAPPGLTITGPVPVGSPNFDKTLYGTNLNLSRVGYEKSQFFLSGTAHSYVPAQPLTSDGKWKVNTGVSAPYKTG